jgi:hypothetical protein
LDFKFPDATRGELAGPLPLVDRKAKSRIIAFESTP